MKADRFGLALLLACCFGVSASAQQPAPTTLFPQPAATATAEPKVVSDPQWDAMRYRLDPKLAVRRKAEIKAAQRLFRLESMRWYGFSNLRPVAAATPFTSVYSHAWAGSWAHPYRWYARQPSTTVIQVAPRGSVEY